ncbi:MAG: proline iminopeptidase-family hydrolase [Lewinellaceae bacterium]|nr:proline iminopeptidase-family hydrolase [Lewinellaceae bacterium]
MKYKLTLLAVFSGVLFFACKNEPGKNSADTETIAKVEIPIPSTEGTDGVRMIPVETPAGTYKVWTRKVGNNPKVKVLLLHGGPAMTTEYMECFGDFLPREGYEMYYYHQLGSYLSDQPSNDDLWVIDRFVEEVEQVRKALGLNKDNGYIIGNSWGGMLGMQYALKYQDNIKALVVSNMQGSFPAYADYNAQLRSQMRPSLIDSLKAFEDKGDYHNPDYQNLVVEEYYRKHICRMNPFPDGFQRAMEHVNGHIYEFMQGPSEFVPGGNLAGWDIMGRLNEIHIPTLMIGAKYDTMDPAAMEEMSKLVQHGRYLYCPEGSHLSMWDDQAHYYPGLLGFIMDVDGGRF